MPNFEMYKRHLADYDLKTAEEISGSAPEFSAPMRRSREAMSNGARFAISSVRRLFGK